MGGGAFFVGIRTLCRIWGTVAVRLVESPSPGMLCGSTGQFECVLADPVRVGGLFLRGRRCVQSATTHARLASGLSGGRGSPIPILKVTSMMVTTATGTPL